MTRAPAATASSRIIPQRVYFKLFTGNYLAKRRVRIDCFENLIDFLCWERFSKGSGIVVHSLDEGLQWRLRDVIIKFEFTLLSDDLLRKVLTESVKLPGPPPGMYQPYFFYNFVFYSKAALDSIAVLLNDWFKLGFHGGDIDLAKSPFVLKVEGKVKNFRNFSSQFNDWTQRLVRFRIALIHKKSVDIYGRLIPLEPLDDFELKEILENYEHAPIHMKRQLQRKMRMVSVMSFVRETGRNLNSALGLMSCALLADLKTRYPRHRSSTKTYD